MTIIHHDIKSSPIVPTTPITPIEGIIACLPYRSEVHAELHMKENEPRNGKLDSEATSKNTNTETSARPLVCECVNCDGEGHGQWF